MNTMIKLGYLPSFKYINRTGSTDVTQQTKKDELNFALEIH